MTHFTKTGPGQTNRHGEKHNQKRDKMGFSQGAVSSLSSALEQQTNQVRTRQTLFGDAI